MCKKSVLLAIIWAAWPAKLDGQFTAMELAAEDRFQGQNFGTSGSISSEHLSSEHLIVGATGDEDLGILSGSAYIFARDVLLRIYDLLGEEVRTLIDGDEPAGTNTVVWDGTNDVGQSVSSGLYVYRLEVVHLLGPARCFI